MNTLSSDRLDRLRGPACDRCRSRKQKCDRVPIRCSNCRLSEAECIYPPGKGRAPKRPRTGLDPQLAHRLSRLEEIVRQASVTQPCTRPTRVSSEADDEEEDEDEHVAAKFGSSKTDLDGSFARLVIDDKSSYYVNNVLWSTLANEVCLPLSVHVNEHPKSHLLLW